MKDKRSFDINLTSSQWVVIATLNTIIKECLPLFPEGPNTPFPIEWSKANQERTRLWEFLKTKISIEYMTVEHVFLRYGKIMRDANDIGIKGRSLKCDIALHQKYGIGIPDHAVHFLELRIGMDLLADCDEWHVRKIYFVPLKDQLDTIFSGDCLEYKIV